MGSCSCVRGADRELTRGCRTPTRTGQIEHVLHGRTRHKVSWCFDRARGAKRASRPAISRPSGAHRLRGCSVRSCSPCFFSPSFHAAPLHKHERRRLPCMPRRHTEPWMAGCGGTCASRNLDTSSAPGYLPPFRGGGIAASRQALAPRRWLECRESLADRGREPLWRLRRSGQARTSGRKHRRLVRAVLFFSVSAPRSCLTVHGRAL